MCNSQGIKTSECEDIGSGTEQDVNSSCVLPTGLTPGSIHK